MNYIIFDLEATCWEGSSNGRQSEVVEIGAVKLNDKLEQLGTFQTFVRPSSHPVLSDFCTKLTSIRQADVDGAPYFSQAMQMFEDWIIDGSSADDVLLLSWGHYDKGQLANECSAKGYGGRILELLENHHSLKHEYAKIKNVKLCGMAAALGQLGIPLEGTHHRGIDDALNIAKIFSAVYREWNNATIKK